MSDSLTYAETIFPEMMSHPALFTHLHPKRIAILGDNDNRILQEVIKHAGILEIQHNNPTLKDPRITASAKTLHPLDIIINATSADNKQLQQLFDSLHKDGILIQQSESPFHLAKLKETATQLKKIGFNDLQFLNFPQPDFASGWRVAIMALKQGIFKRPREKIIFNKPFQTAYYNFDIHKAASVLPEFMRYNHIF